MLDKLKIGIAGLGTVGVGVVKMLEKNSVLIAKRCGREIVVTAVSARSKDKDRGIDISDATWYENATDIANDDNVDLVVELIGGHEGAAYDLCVAALKNGKDFITANKALIARRGYELAQLAEENGVTIAYEAAVAGGIPVIKALKEGAAGNEILQISGILNGTCNYILTAMKETERDFDVILKEAQDLGYAEADPAFDVDGIDAAHKLAILTSIAYATPVNFDKVDVTGITGISLLDIKCAGELGYKIKLLGVCKKTETGIFQAVYPCLIDAAYPLAKTDGVNNAIFIEGDFVGNIVLEGPGAGQGATASAVLSDIIDIAAGRKSYTFNIPASDLTEQKFANANDYEGEYYLRINVLDRPGVLADITDILKNEGVSVESILQKPAKSSEKVDIFGATHKIDEKTMIKAVAKIEKLDNVLNKPTIIRILKS